MDETIQFAPGFERKTDLEKLEAIGNVLDDPWLIPDDEMFHDISDPVFENDWLAQYEEAGQTFHEFLQLCPWLSKEKVSGYFSQFLPEGENLREKYPEGKIYLAQLGDFEEGQQGIIAPNFQALEFFAEIFHNIPVENFGTFLLQPEGSKLFVLAPDDHREKEVVKRPRRRSRRSQRFQVKFREKSGCLQLQCPHLLKHLSKLIPSDGICLVTLTMIDLFEANPDLFVAGLASGNERVAVFSFARYDPALKFSKEFWHQISWDKTAFSSEERRKLILSRSCKLLVHEVGHLLGLDHCVFYDCCMNGSGHLEEDFRQPIFLCPVCLNKLKSLTGVDIRQRYMKMKSFFEANSMIQETNWIKKRLNTKF